jgi:hypothetical protein
MPTGGVCPNAKKNEPNQLSERDFPAPVRQQDRARHPPLQGASEKRYHPLQHGVIRGMLAEMGRQVAVVLYVVAMAAVIVGVDFVFFRNRFWERLTVNIGIVWVFAAFYLRFLRRDSALSQRLCIKAFSSDGRGNQSLLRITSVRKFPVQTIFEDARRFAGL